MSLTSSKSSIAISNAPAFVPQPGFIGPVPTNNAPQDATPSGFSLPTLESSIWGQLQDWGAKGIVVPDWGASAAYPGVASYSGGHTTDGKQSPCPFIFDTTPSGTPTALRWKATNVPLATDGITPIQHPSTFPPVPGMPTQLWNGDQEWGGTDETTNLGTTALGVPCQSTTPGHTYLTPLVIPFAGGGGPKGTLVYQNPSGPGPNGFGDGLSAAIHGLDLSKDVMGHSRITPSKTGWNFAPPGQGPGTMRFYYGTAYDSSRNGIWGCNFNAHSGLAPNSVSALLQGWAPSTLVDTNSTAHYTKFVDGGQYGFDVGQWKYYKPADILFMWMPDQTIWAKPANGTTASGTGFKKMTLSGTPPEQPLILVNGVPVPDSSWPADVSLNYSTLMPDSFFLWDCGAMTGANTLAVNPGYPVGRVFRLRIPSGTQSQVLNGTWTWSSQDLSFVSGYSFPAHMPSVYVNGTMGALIEIPGWSTPGVNAAFFAVMDWVNTNTIVGPSAAAVFSIPVT